MKYNQLGNSKILVIFILLFIGILASLLISSALLFKVIKNYNLTNAFKRVTEITDNLGNDIEKNIEKGVYDDIQKDLVNLNDVSTTTSSTASAQATVKLFRNGTEIPLKYVTPIITQIPLKNQQPCTRYEIPSGEFKSNKCYTSADYANLLGALQDYDYAEFSYNTAKDTMKYTCDGSDIFKDQCEYYKKEKAQAEKDMDKFRKLINNYITKGQ